MTDTTTNVQMDEITQLMIAQGLLPPAAIEEAPSEIIEGAVEEMDVSAEAAEIDELDETLQALAIEAEPDSIIEGEVMLSDEGLDATAGIDAEPIGDDVLEDLISSLAIDDAKTESYAEQEATGDVSTETPVAAAKPPKAPRVAKAPKEAKPAAEPRVSRLAGTTHGAYVATTLGDAALEALVGALPVKVQDKASNLADHLAKGKALSVYTQVAVTMLRDTGAMSNPSLVAALTAHAKRSNPGAGYSIGTARSQAGQMMSLFGKLGITVADGAKGQTPNAASPIWTKLAA